MKKTVMQKMVEDTGKLTPAQQKVASYIQKNPTEVAFLTMEQFALKAKVSVATIMRLAYQLGFSGYSELQKEMQKNIRQQLEPYKQFAKGISEIAVDDLLQKYADQHISNIQKTVGILSIDDLDQAAKMLFKAKKVYLIGYRSSSAIANYLEDRMARIGVDCEHMVADTGRNQALLSKMDSNSTIVAISFPRYATPTISMVQIAKERGCKVIGITDHAQSPLGQLAEISLHCAFDSMVFHNSLVSAFFVADLLLLSIARNYPEQIQENLEKIEEVIKEIKANVF
jgi:Transcriptional regulators